MRFFLFFFCASVSFAQESKFIEISPGNRLFVRYQEAKNAAPTIVLLHGLTYSNDSWDLFVHSLRKENPSLGILRFDMVGMGQTLLDRKVPVDYEISYQTQAENLSLLLNKLKLKKVVLAGLSYGGGIAVAFANQYPEHISSLILMAPFTEPLKKMDNWIKMQVSITRATNPWNPATDDELYDFYLRQFIYSTYPSAEPSVLENPYKLEAIYRMVQGIRHFKVKKSLENLPKESLHLMVAVQDQYIPGDVMNSFWNAVPNEVRASRINISETEHKIPEAIPDFAASWIHQISIQNKNISSGRVFKGSTKNCSAKSGAIIIELCKE